MDDDIFSSSDSWIEQELFENFRVWHVMAIVLGTALAFVILGCCCCRFRIPRTKQEIEADYKRKQLAKKFREKLALISNTDMENMDLSRAVSIIQGEIDKETEPLNKMNKQLNMYVT
uniref:Transmembrane inner ear expressed protein n=1 Tax=Megaselia scalaris TaxID=36166 RepID=T1H562_MEGSC